MIATGSYGSSLLPARYSRLVTLGTDGRYQPVNQSVLERLAPKAGISSCVPAAGAGAAVGATQAHPISATRPYINRSAPPMPFFKYC